MSSFVFVLVAAVVATLAGECAGNPGRFQVPLVAQPYLGSGLPFGGYGHHNQHHHNQHHHSHLPYVAEHGHGSHGGHGGNSAASASAAAGGSASASASATGAQHVAHHEPHHVQHYMEPTHYAHQPHYEPHYAHQPHHQPNTCAAPPCYGGLVQQTVVVPQNGAQKPRRRLFGRRRPQHQPQVMHLSPGASQLGHY